MFEPAASPVRLTPQRGWSTLPLDMNRRDLLKRAGASVAVAAAMPLAGWANDATQATVPDRPLPGDADRARRMSWWHAARFGMFIHWGVYSVYGRHEWVMLDEGIPVSEYAPRAKLFRPKPNAPHDFARLARQAGQKYMVMTTKHHEGFCNFATKLTDYCAPNQGPGRDLVREYVDAARAEGLRVGFYYSLMDWHHPDGASCAVDEAARRRFVEYTHGLIRELMTHYGKIDVLWYDMAVPLNAEQWESERMNKMVFELQPDIIVNNRNGLPGDFSTPEQEVVAAQGERAWESCMTLNDSWGYQAADDNWKSPKTVIRNLISCSRDGGNYLLNIGPRADGSIPEQSARVLGEVGRWLERNGQAIYETDRCQPRHSDYCDFTRKGNTLYVHTYFWPGDYVAVAGLKCTVKSARFLAGGERVNFVQDKFRVRFTGLPKPAPDSPVVTIAVECDSEPTQDMEYVMRDKPRDGASSGR